MSNHFFVFTGAMCFCALAACGKSESGMSAANASAAESTPPSSQSAAAASTTGSSASLSDPNLVWILDQANAGDSARGRLAETKGTTADVRNFGKLMMGEHHALRAEGEQLAKKLSVTPQAPPNDESASQAQTEMASLVSTPKGKGWDRSYIAYEVNYHQGILQAAGGFLGAAQNQQLKDLLKESGAVVQKHLDLAKQIQQKLGS